MEKAKIATILILAAVLTTTVIGLAYAQYSTTQPTKKNSIICNPATENNAVCNTTQNCIQLQTSQCTTNQGNINCTKSVSNCSQLNHQQAMPQNHYAHHERVIWRTP